MRSDILVSVAVVDEQGPAATVPRLAGLARALAAQFVYFELVYVLPESAKAEIEPLSRQLALLPNLRIIFASDGTRFYRRRLIGALEAIGDIVVVLDLDELSHDMLCHQIAEAHRRNEVLIGWRPSRRSVSLSYGLLSLLSRNLISAQTARTIILPRELIQSVVSRRSAALDLRFEPRNALSRYRHFDIDGVTSKGGSGGRGAASRAELFLEILLSGVPRYLTAYAAAGFGVMIGAVTYGIYAVMILLLRDHVQEGWFSTAIVQAGSTAFIAGGMSLLAVAMIAIYELQHSGDDRVIVDEIANTSFFDKISARNVELADSDARTDG
ncbi:MAG: hypothetical protein ACKOPO_10415 [Novosphingobium sp.]